MLARRGSSSSSDSARAPRHPVSPPPWRTRHTAASSNSPPYYMQKRENAGKHDRIKAATNFNAGLLSAHCLCEHPGRARVRGTFGNTNNRERYFHWYSRRSVRNCVIENTHIEFTAYQFARISTIANRYEFINIIHLISPRARYTDAPFFHFSNFSLFEFLSLYFNNFYIKLY